MNMINGMTPEEYANAVANLCRQNFHISEIDDGKIVSITEHVQCRRLCTVSDTRHDSLEFSTFYAKFNVPYDSHEIYESVYDEVLKQASHADCICDHHNYEERMLIEYPVLMFLTRILCKPHESPNDVTAAYISAVHDTLDTTIPKELIVVGDDIVSPHFKTTIGFGFPRMNAGAEYQLTKPVVNPISFDDFLDGNIPAQTMEELARAVIKVCSDALGIKNPMGDDPEDE